MNSVFLAPHHDDEALFGSFSIIPHQPLVVVCYRSQKQDGQGVTHAEREAESAAACETLGASGFIQWDCFDTQKGDEEPYLREMMSGLTADLVFAPAVEDDGGHDQHDLVGRLALEVFGPERVVRYLTYTYGRNRSTWGERVPYEPAWIEQKLCALSCYHSQHRLESCAHHFLADQNEYVVA